MGGFDKARRFWIIAQSLADLTNGDFENGFADEGFRPDGVQKFLFCTSLARTANEITEHSKGFGSELYRPWSLSTSTRLRNPGKKGSKLTPLSFLIL